MTVTTHTTNRQVVHASTLAELIAAPGFHTGMMATVGNNGAGEPACYGVYPIGTLPVSSPHVVNSTANPVQFIDEFARLNGGLAPFAHAATHYPGGSDAINLSNATTAGFSPAQGTTANRFLGTNGSGVASYTTVPWASLSSVPSSFSPSAHASRHVSSGADPIPVAAGGVTGLMPAPPTTGIALPTSVNGNVAWATQIGTAYILAGSTPDRVLSTNGSDAAWTQVSNSMISGVDWSKVTNKTHASTHLTGGSDAIQEATGLVAGLMSASAMAKLNGIPYPAGGTDDGKLLRATGVPGQYTLATLATIGLVTGSGTAGYLPKFTGTRALGNSLLSESAGVVTVDGVVQGKNHSLYGTGATAQWVRVGTFTAAQSGQTIRVAAYVHAGYNAANNQDAVVHITFKTSNGGQVDANGFAGNGSYYVFGGNDWFTAPGRIKWKSNAAGVNATAFDLYMYLPTYAEGSHYDVTVNAGATWTTAPTGGQADPGVASSTVLIPQREFVVRGQITITGGSPGVGKLLQSDAAGLGSWSSELAELTNITFAADAASPFVTQANAADAAAGLRIGAQSTAAAGRGGGPLFLQAGSGPLATSGNVAAGTSGTVVIQADGAGASASFGVDMVNISTPLLVHGEPVFSVSGESHVLSRKANFSMFEDVRWYQQSTSTTTQFTFDIPTGMNGKWTVIYTVYASGLDVVHKLGSVWTRSGGTLVWSNGFTIYHSIANAFATSASSDNMRLTVTPPSSASITWTIKAEILRV